jgi:hypothetical protein
MITTSYPVSICVDCLFAAANGQPSDDPDYPTPDREPLGLLAVGEWVELSDDEGSFSWSPCDTCGSTLGGDRFDAMVLEAQS